MKQFENRIVGEADVSPDTLLANPKNWRTHPEFQQKSLEAVLKEVGWVQRVVVNKRTGLIVDGHLRVELAKKRKEATIPVVYVDLDEAEESLILTTFDPISQLAGTDNELLSELLQNIETDDLDIQALLNTLKPNAEGDLNIDAEGGLTDPDDAPAKQEKAVTQRGEVWVLGKHRVMCGDSTDANNIRTLMAGKKADCSWQDPPYGVKYEKGDHRAIENDEKQGDELAEFLLAALSNTYDHVKDGGACYVAYADSQTAAFWQAYTKAGWRPQGNVIWVKNTITLGRTDHQYQHEPILYGWKPTGPHHWHGDRKQRTVPDIAARGLPGLRLADDGAIYAEVGDELIRLKPEAEILPSSVVRIPKPARNALHPTMKPVALVEKGILNSTLPGEVVLDPFGGSGSTLIACAQSGRAARLMEYDPLYVDVIVRRWQEFTGKQAVLEGDGHTFDEIAQARLQDENP